MYWLVHWVRLTKDHDNLPRRGSRHLVRWEQFESFSGSAQTIPVTIEISSAVGLGNYAITLVAVSADGLQHKTANLGLQVQSAAPDFSLQMASSSSLQ